MKKTIYAFLIAIASSLVFSSCTEEEVAPSAFEFNGGGSGIPDKGM